MPEKIVLRYFNVRGRAEVARWILAYAGQDYLDDRVEGPQSTQWKELKDKTPFGQLPVLEVDGKMLAQSRTIGRYLAHKYGLAGTSKWEHAQVDSIVDYIDEIDNCRVKYIQACMKRSDDVENVKATFLQKEVVPYLQKLENLLGGGKSYFCGDEPTWADFAVVIFLDEVASMSSDALAPYENLRALSERTHSLKGIKEYLSKRPATKF
ncbi:hypothetical protein RvY_04327 [Ramazzottius varieornatus]|uniref:glutathione transferase n=1 Tax=Ramazzottius varieornatus TaxID=947166 RepID=A0A1D1UUT9_RAMVA|nr:hypothetical protein RvY_04327 [Ramazzottius varieornatus]